MKKLLFITFICSSLCAYAQSEIPEDTIKNRPPVKKEQIPFSPKENKRTGLDESQPQQSLQGEQQEEINLHPSLRLCGAPALDGHEEDTLSEKHL